MRPISDNQVSKMNNPPRRKNLHIVLGDELMGALEDRCNELNISKSEAGRLLIQAFISGVVTIEYPRMVPVKEGEK